MAVAQPLRSILVIRIRLLDGLIIPRVTTFRIDSCGDRVLEQNSANSGKNDSRLVIYHVEAEFLLTQSGTVLAPMQIGDSVTRPVSECSAMSLCLCAGSQGVIDENRLFLAS